MRDHLVRYVGWLAGAVGLVVVLTGLAAGILPSLQPLCREGGILEMMSLLFLLLALVFSVWTFARSQERLDRLLCFWGGVLAALAFLRELDAHVLLNPKHLGVYGVRFRIDWWLDGSVSLWLKLGWLGFFVVLLAALFYPPWALRSHLLDLLRRGEVIVGLFFLFLALSGLGFVVDDLLRNTKLLSLDVRQTAEETFEMLGAAAFLAGVAVRWRAGVSRLALAGLQEP